MRHESVPEVARTIIQDLMDKVLEKVLAKDPFIAEKHHASKPLYAALVPDGFDGNTLK